MQPLFAQDADGDGILDTTDNCPFYWNMAQTDIDGDGAGDECDNCIDRYNSDQDDTDGDGVGDSCEFEDNIGIEFISTTYPHSVNYPIEVVFHIQNVGAVDYSVIIFRYQLENEDGILPPGPMPMEFPWPSLPSGDTFELQFDITPPDTGLFRICCFLLSPDDQPDDDIAYSPWFRVYPEREGYFAHHYNLRELGWHAEAGEGPAMLFHPQGRFPLFNVQKLEIELHGTGEFKFLVYDAPESPDTIPEDNILLFESEVLSVNQAQQCAYYSLDVSEVADLQGLSDPFFVCVKMQDGNDLYWTGASPLYPPTYSFLLDNGEWNRAEYDYNLRCYFSWGFCKGTRGDATGDGVINVIDVLAAVNHLLSLALITQEAFCRADCNADGLVNILDALNIMNVVLETGTCEP
jgi:hypothetical protein